MQDSDHGGFVAPPGADSPLSYAVSERDRNIMAMVKEAVARRHVMLAFQPVIPAARPDRPAFWEGLIRIMDSTGRVIPARDFIDTIETTEAGRQIDCLSLEMGLQTLLDNPGLRLSINMSARSIGYPRWMDVLNRGLSHDPTIAERLILEITESSAMVVPDIVQVFMADMQHRGVAFALDDFGAGYTAFRYLRQFYFDILKIDGQFIQSIHADPDNQVLTQAMISIARHFEMFTVAEYVETAEDADFLTEVGIDCMQGYFFGAPTTRPYWITGDTALRAG
ncbi:EAL domain-containing protein [Psychromarinibacter sp. C21-152]|uniref:EAL domain-containing protein n=1 Tax=Psychromarinibacter sediminicola TaxID=3033385 RepID=A0AAE3NN57_9RHOB|nr:EAL domain-containing protein [Psychromarinibacter sediminicola]MDF0601023.1 EAL domain-containing protein [Psychromarinibacter sediminicola]